MTKDELDKILKDHMDWTKGRDGGKRANLRGADLRGADLSGANLSDANLRGAYLSGANLSDADLPPFQIPQDGTLTAYKKAAGHVVKLLIPAKAKRTASLVGRKYRAEYVKVLAIYPKCESVHGDHDEKTIYKVGEIVRPDSYDADIRIECSHGIHFFLTREEAEAY